MVNIYIATIINPILVVIISKIYKYFNVEEILALIASFSFIFISGYYLGKKIGVIKKLRELEKKHNITFKTEYRKLLEEKSQP